MRKFEKVPKLPKIPKVSEIPKFLKNQNFRVTKLISDHVATIRSGHRSTLCQSLSLIGQNGPSGDPVQKLAEAVSKHVNESVQGTDSNFSIFELILENVNSISNIDVCIFRVLSDTKKKFLTHEFSKFPYLTQLSKK